MDFIQAQEGIIELRRKLEQVDGLVDLNGNVIADGVEVNKFAEALCQVEGVFAAGYFTSAPIHSATEITDIDTRRP